MVTDEGEVLGTGCNNLRIILIIQINLNTVNHEQVGETFLQQLGFPPEVTQFVRGHVQVRPRIVDIGSISLSSIKIEIFRKQLQPATSHSFVCFYNTPNVSLHDQNVKKLYNFTSSSCCHGRSYCKPFFAG